MPRVIWKGALSFSLIHIPVSLYAASRSALEQAKVPAAPTTTKRRTAEVVDLGELLKRSLAQRSGKGAASAPANKRTEAAASRTRAADTGTRPRRRA